MDQLQQVLSFIAEYVHEHWIKFVTAAAFMAVGWFWGRRRPRSEWQRKEFLHRLNVSLNILKDGKLMIRTEPPRPNSAVLPSLVAATNPWVMRAGANFSHLS